MEKVKVFFRELWLFLSSRIFLLNFGKLLLVAALLFFFITTWLKCYTHHGESVSVNDFTGMHLLDAQKASASKGFEFVVIDSVWMDGQPSGIIIQQDPLPLSKVKEGRKIYVTVTGQPGPVRLPKLSDSSYDYELYAARLSRLGIKSKIKEEVYDSRQAPNTVLYLVYNGQKVTESDIKNGFDVMMGSTVEFVVTKRYSNEVEMPDLVCRTLDEAVFLLSSAGFSLGEVFQDETIINRNTAYVYRQEPAYLAGELVPVGSQFNVWITQQLPAGCSNSGEEEF